MGNKFCFIAIFLIFVSCNKKNELGYKITKSAIYFVKGNEPLPVSKQYKINDGEAGLDDRLTDYLVVDSFTADKFNDPYACARMPVECDFFKQLATGRSNHYQLLKEFTYTLPPYLPQINFLFTNPTIRIYERIK